MSENVPPSARGRLRRLSPEEIELWLQVTRSVVPRPGSLLPPRAALAQSTAIPMPESNSIPAPASQGASVPAPQNTPPPIPALAPLDRRLKQKLARGRSAPDAAIDLHGMYQHQAYVALQHFLLQAQKDGAKIVLVVTGKGERERLNGESGVLRRSVPLWLQAPEFRPIIVGFEEAARPHGGTGALYVRIRRRERLQQLK
ncbi:MAG TPA: Smr/MutS family protein [Beijerinckia sp.]|nr:Smr/MutS family protein [Beijerinckia sp.]